MKRSVLFCILFTRVIFAALNEFEKESACMKTDRFKKELQKLEEIPNELTFGDTNDIPVPITTKIKPDLPEQYKNGTVTFTLFTKKNPTNGQIIEIDKVNKLEASNFDSRKPTRIITHGWYKKGTDACCTVIRDAYLKNYDCNVIVVDWSAYSMTDAYIYSACKVKSVGLEVAEMIKFLEENGKMVPSKTTLIGHSLGAHVMGIAGHQSEPGHKIHSIVGLDPALPGFNFATGRSSISKESAKHVQIIHTNAGLLGYNGAVGDVDFYPNGGTFQPGCGIHKAGCSHARAWKFFAESISSAFKGVKCDSYKNIESCTKESVPVTAIMGGFEIPPKTIKPGKYYLKTNEKPPYSKWTG